MIHVETLRRLLALADVARDPYTVAEAAADLLTANAEDAVAAGHYLRALAALKLYGAARRLPHAALREHVGSLSAAPSGVIPWNSRARRFRANVQALAQRNALAAERISEAAGSLDRYELHQSADGNYHVLDTRAPVVWSAWLGGAGGNGGSGLANHSNVDAVWRFDKAKTPVPPPIAFDGVGYGWLLQRVLATTEQSFLSYSCAVYVLECDPAALAIVLHMHDLQAALSGPRLRWFVDATPAAVLAEFHKELDENPAWSDPQQVITTPLTRRPAMPVQAATEEHLAHRAATREHLLKQIDVHYAGCDHRYWRKRFAEAVAHGEAGSKGGGPLRVLGITTRYSTVLQHSMREMQAAVQAAGHEMQIAIEPDDQSVENPFVERIAEFKPDLIFQISRMRYENPHIPRHVPFLAWDQDNLPCMRTDAATASLDRLTYVAGHGAFHGYVYLGWPRRNCIMCQPAAATHRYAGRELPAGEIERYRCDLSYVSNASGSAAELRDQLAVHWGNDAHTEALFRGLTDAVLATDEGTSTWNSPRLQAVLAELQNRRGVELAARTASELVMSAVTVADRAFRHAVLRWAADLADRHGYSLRLYGHGWDEGPRFAKYAAGPARQGDELLAIYRATRINLQIIETGFLHSRSLDGMAAGGFFLTRRTDYDGFDRSAIEARDGLSRYIRAHGVERASQLEESSDLQVRRWWQEVKEELRQHMLGASPDPGALLRCVETFADTPAACVIFPQFDQIGFADRESFAARARQFLGDEALRQSVAEQMRQVVQEYFSYDARWKQFLAAITAGLAD